MNTNSQEIKSPTRGEWFVTTSEQYVPDGEPVYIAVAQAETNQIIALLGAETDELANEHIANAALIAVAPQMLDALIAIQESLNSSINVIDLEGMNTMISEVFAKLANEAGEEL